MTYLFVISLLNLPATAVGTSVPALRLSLIGRKSRGAFVSATLIGQSKKENELKRILFFCVRTP